MSDLKITEKIIRSMTPKFEHVICYGRVDEIIDGLWRKDEHEHMSKLYSQKH